MYKLKSTVIRVIPNEDIDPEVIEEGIFVMRAGPFDDGSIHITFDGKAYELFEGEYKPLEQEEVADILLKKLDRMEDNLLKIGAKRR